MKQGSSRRDVLKKLASGAAVAAGGGLLWGTVVAESGPDQSTLRPPGARKGKAFDEACIRCGQCMEACPYDTLKLGRPGEQRGQGTPWFEPRDIPCYMCPSYPCTEACPSGALDIRLLSRDNGDPHINHAEMGLAVVHRESCIAFWGIQCDACYRACPRMDVAITLVKEKNLSTGKHANLLPLVHSDACTGCGVCEHACVVEKAAIRVLPVELAMGRVGNHYIKSWEEGDEQRIRDIAAPGNSDDRDLESALDYLNDENDPALE